MNGPANAFADPAERERALKSTLNILDYADNTERKLREKLARKGFARDAIDYAVEYVKNCGLLDDRRYMRDLVDRAVRVKLYGRRRVTQELFAKGFTRGDIESFDFSEFDFPAACAERIRKTARRYPDRDKLYASLARSGFTPNDITLAFQMLKKEE